LLGKQLTDEALETLNCFGQNAQHLQKLALYLLNRNT